MQTEQIMDAAQATVDTANVATDTAVAESSNTAVNALAAGFGGYAFGRLLTSTGGKVTVAVCGTLAVGGLGYLAYKTYRNKKAAA